MDPISPRQLFGGAVEVSMPERMVDISDFRSVPDNQEVSKGWLSTCSIREHHSCR